MHLQNFYDALISLTRDAEGLGALIYQQALEIKKDFVERRSVLLKNRVNAGLPAPFCSLTPDIRLRDGRPTLDWTNCARRKGIKSVSTRCPPNVLHKNTNELDHDLVIETDIQFRKLRHFWKYATKTKRSLQAMKNQLERSGLVLDHLDEDQHFPLPGADAASKGAIFTRHAFPAQTEMDLTLDPGEQRVKGTLLKRKEIPALKPDR